MKALVYLAAAKNGLEERPKPKLNEPTDAIVRVTMTTICGTDLHILKGDVPSCQPGCTLGHEGVGVIDMVGPADRMKFCCVRGALWDGLWGLFLGGLFVAVPVVGPVVALGYLASIAISAIESAVIVGGLSVIGTAYATIGIPENSILRYETAVKADGFLVMAHGTADEVERAKAILGTAAPSRLEVHAGSASHRVQAGG